MAHVMHRYLNMETKTMRTEWLKAWKVIGVLASQNIIDAWMRETNFAVKGWR